jgi:hypothetical protein
MANSKKTVNSRRPRGWIEKVQEILCGKGIQVEKWKINDAVHGRVGDKSLTLKILEALQEVVKEEQTKKKKIQKLKSQL